jgi:hypothetical protein
MMNGMINPAPHNWQTVLVIDAYLMAIPTRFTPHFGVPLAVHLGGIVVELKNQSPLRFATFIPITKFVKPR